MSRTAAKPTPRRSSLNQQEADFTAEGAPPPGDVTSMVTRATLPGDGPALKTLQTTLAAETARGRRLEREIRRMRSALHQAREALAGTQAGERQARHLALHDGLTSLPNRRFFLQRLDLALAGVSPRHPALAVLYLDLDGFKPINDLYGHDAGDELLTIVAARLARAVRAEDMMSRLGGDEFACLPADVANLEQLSLLAAKLFHTVSAPLALGRVTLTIRPSIGIATFPVDGQTADALLRSADAAMYCAKRQQSGYAFCDRQVGVPGLRQLPERSLAPPGRGLSHRPSGAISASASPRPPAAG